MVAEGLDPRQRITARALLVGDSLDVRALKYSERLASSPLMVAVAGRGSAVLFRYGAVVFFDVDPLEEAAFLRSLRPLVHDPMAEPAMEALDVVVDPSVPEGFEQDHLLVADTRLERLQIVADILAKSAVLGHYEDHIAQTFDQVEPLAAQLQRTGRSRQAARALTRQIGSTLLSLHRMVGRVEVGEKPETLWEFPELERLYVRLEGEYEIRERQLALERKLEVIARTVETLLDLLQARRTLRVEWYIVILIVVEILLTLYELFWHTA
jgi:uncharacterized Rmd1/YagE family protein